MSVKDIVDDLEPRTIPSNTLLVCIQNMTTGIMCREITIPLIVPGETLVIAITRDIELRISWPILDTTNERINHDRP